MSSSLFAKPVAARDAATVIIARPSGHYGEPLDRDSSWELLMVKRSSKSPFMPDTYVYPGGALDQGDTAPTMLLHIEGLNASEAHTRLCEPHLSMAQALGLFVSAVREVFEEAGILFARRRSQQALINLIEDEEVAQRFTAYRHALQRNELSMVELLEREELVLELGGFGYFARWITPLAEARRFDARFFVVRAPIHQRALHDEHELVEHLWASPKYFLERQERGELSLAPPTLSTLTRLREVQSIDMLEALGAATHPTPQLPHFAVDSDTPTLLLPSDPDYPEELRRLYLEPFWESRCQDVPPWNRLELREGRWRVVLP